MKTIKLSTLLIFLFVNQSFAISVKGCFGKINQVLNHASNKGKSVLYRGDFNKKLYLDELKALKESSSLAKEEGSYSTIEKRLALITYLEETSALGLKSFDQLTTERQKNIDRLVKYVNSLNLDQGLSRYEVKKMTALYYDASSEKAGFVSRILKRLKLNPEELLFEKIALDTLEFGVIKRIEEDFLRNNGLMESVRPKEKALAFTKKFFESLVSLPAALVNGKMIKVQLSEEEMNKILSSGLGELKEELVKKYGNRIRAQMAIDHIRHALLVTGTTTSVYFAYQYASGDEKVLNKRTLKGLHGFALQSFVESKAELAVLRGDVEASERNEYQLELIEEYQEYTVDEIDELIEELNKERESFAKERFEAKRKKRVEQMIQSREQGKVDDQRKLVQLREIVTKDMVLLLSSKDDPLFDTSSTAKLVAQVEGIVKNLKKDELIKYLNSTEKRKFELVVGWLTTTVKNDEAETESLTSPRSIQLVAPKSSQLESL